MNELTLLQTFLAVFRMGSVTQAADHLSITQPGASGHLKVLESRLGKTLFEKEGRRLCPTAAADDLARSIGPHLDSIEGALLSAKIGRKEFSGTVHFGGPVEFVSSMICPLLGAALANRIQVQIRFGPSQDVVKALADGTLDLAVSTLRIRSAAVSYLPLYRERFVLVGPPALASELSALSNDVQRLDLIHAQPMISYASDLPILRRYWRDIFKQDIEAEPALIAPDLRAVMTCVTAGLGVSVLPHYLCRDAIGTGALAILHDDKGQSFNDLLLGCNRYAVNHPRVSFLRDHLVQAFQQAEVILETVGNHASSFK